MVASHFPWRGELLRSKHAQECNPFQDFVNKLKYILCVVSGGTRISGTDSARSSERQVAANLRTLNKLCRVCLQVAIARFDFEVLVLRRSFGRGVVLSWN